MKSKSFLMLQAAVSAALMAILIYMTRDSLPKMLAALRHLPLHIFLFAFLIFTISNVIASCRLKILLATQEIFLNLGNLVRLTFMGYFFSSFLPTSFGGDVVKAFYVAKTSNKTMQSYTSVFMDRLLGMCSIFLIATVAIFYVKGIPGLRLNWLLPLSLASAALFLLCLFNRRLADALTFFVAPAMPVKIREKLRDVYDALHDYKNHRLKITECLFISIGGQAVAFSAAYVFGLGLDSYMPLKFVLLAMPVASIASMVPSINGIGPRETAAVLMLSPVIGEEKAMAIAFLWLGMLLLTALIGGIVYMLMGWHRIELDDLPAYSLTDTRGRP